VIIDLAAERGGNAEGTVMDEKVVTDNGVTIVGYTDFPSRMASQASSLYATNIRHMMTDLTPEKDGAVNHKATLHSHHPHQKFRRLQPNRRKSQKS